MSTQQTPVSVEEFIIRASMGGCEMNVGSSEFLLFKNFKDWVTMAKFVLNKKERMKPRHVVSSAMFKHRYSAEFIEKNWWKWLAFMEHQEGYRPLIRAQLLSFCSGNIPVSLEQKKFKNPFVSETENLVALRRELGEGRFVPKFVKEFVQDINLGAQNIEFSYKNENIVAKLELASGCLKRVLSLVGYGTLLGVETNGNVQKHWILLDGCKEAYCLEYGVDNLKLIQHIGCVNIPRKESCHA